MARLTHRGSLMMTAAAGVVAGIVGPMLLSLLVTQASPPMPRPNLHWEVLESDDGPVVMRTRTPTGWLIHSDDAYLVVVDDPEHKWLTRKEE